MLVFLGLNILEAQLKVGVIFDLRFKQLKPANKAAPHSYCTTCTKIVHRCTFGASRKVSAPLTVSDFEVCKLS